MVEMTGFYYGMNYHFKPNNNYRDVMPYAGVVGNYQATFEIVVLWLLGCFIRLL